VRQERPERLPLSFAQQRLWFLDRLEGSSSEYNMPEALRLRGDLDISALERALDALKGRHEILRTHFGEQDGEPFQIIDREVRIPLRVEDLSELEEGLRQEAAKEALRREAAEPFDLSQGPLLRTGLLKLGPQDHILHWTCHHIISDGWSVGVFSNELSSLYASFCQARPANLADLSVQYVDYALYQRHQMDGGELEGLLEYWRRQLSDLPVLELGTDHPRPSSPNVDGSMQTLLLPESLCKDLRDLSSREGATMAMLLLAAFELLLGRLSGQDDMAVGVPIAGRGSVESEELIGLFVNTLVLRARLDGDLTFRQLLAQVRKSSLEAYAHQEMPFEKLVEVLNPERVLNRHPLFEVLFNYLSVSRPTLDLPGLSVERLRPEVFRAKFPMTLYMEEISGGLMLRLVYQTALFLPERSGHILDQFRHLLSQIAEKPDLPIRAYSLVTEAARGLLPDPTIVLAEPEQLPVPRGFLSHAERNPHQIALSQEGERWTYQQLATSAVKIAKLLAAGGVQPGDVVAVSGPRSFGLISGIMGVLIARGVLLMLDPSLPSARRDLMLQLASGRHWLSVGNSESANEEWSQHFRSLPHTRISCDGERVRAQGENSPETEISRHAEPEDPAYVFFTSGTTGTPKGILGTHKALSHFIGWEQQTLGVSFGDRVAQLTGLSFDVVLRDIFLPLTAGATLCLPDSASESHETSIVPWLLRERITILHTVPSLASAWLEGLESPMPLPDLRWVLFAGEPLTALLVHRWREKIGTAGGIFNLYGPTETTLAKCAHRVPQDVSPGVQPIGGPLPNSQALVINQADQLCGIGEPGEIVIRTPFRTLGYLDGSPEGRAGFVLNPFRADPGDLVYRSGDIGCYDSRGLLRISERLDDQVKIRGNRVEPAEISAVLARHPAIRQSAVVVHEKKAGERFLIAYVLQEPNSGLRDPKELRGFLKRRLPDYMIPAFFVGLDTLPLTANGKLDRKALPAPDIARLQATQDYVAPRDSTEQVLASLWSMLLKVDEVGIHEDFFELGGHSLTATRLVAHISREFGVEIPLRAIFENPTIESLAIQIAEKRAGSVASEDVEDILRDLESLPEEAAEGELIEREAVLPSATSPFDCPKTRSRFFGTRQCNLLIVINERFERRSFEELASYVREFDPAINALVTRDQASIDISMPRNPTLIFSPALIRHRPPVEGRLFCGYPLSKSQEYVALEKTGIPVPKWTLLSEEDLPDLSEFDDYVVKKPDHGGRGAEVKIVRKSRVRWKPVTTSSAGACSSFILQKFIYTGPRPVCYRVNTLFGRVLYSLRYEARNDRPAWSGPEDREFDGRSIVASAKDSSVALNYEEDIIRLGERAHYAFPEIPLLGFDIIREVPSGKLFVLEANAIGYVWSFHNGLEASFGFSAAEQFDGLRKAAYILAEKTQESAH
jgi:amino acid adenylation domain-containing protein